MHSSYADGVRCGRIPPPFRHQETSMQRINIIGTSGSGKSTLGKALAARLQAPYIEMDSLYWLPAWQNRDDDAFFALLASKLQGECWVLDGNYGRSQPVKWAQVDTIIWLDYSWPRTVWQALRRAITRCWQGRELWPGTGNVESWRQTFCSRDSVLLWTLQTWRSNRQRYQALLQDPAYGHIRFIRLQSPRQTRQWLASVAEG